MKEFRFAGQPEDVSNSRVGSLVASSIELLENALQSDGVAIAVVLWHRDQPTANILVSSTDIGRNAAGVITGQGAVADTLDAWVRSVRAEIREEN